MESTSSPPDLHRAWSVWFTATGDQVGQSANTLRWANSGPVSQTPALAQRLAFSRTRWCPSTVLMLGQCWTGVPLEMGWRSWKLASSYIYNNLLCSNLQNHCCNVSNIFRITDSIFCSATCSFEQGKLIWGTRSKDRCRMKNRILRRNPPPPQVSEQV